MTLFLHAEKRSVEDALLRDKTVGLEFLSFFGQTDNTTRRIIEVEGNREIRFVVRYFFLVFINCLVYFFFHLVPFFFVSYCQSCLLDQKKNWKMNKKRGGERERMWLSYSVPLFFFCSI